MPAIEELVSWDLPVLLFLKDDLYHQGEGSE
jgi:hypothetical protein